ncbi:hypothetical protein THAOC_36238 [Thalassiosira oceanica]|uniref:Uncharacterized protein n=1 Tax=Thalassiosira oceanica TaxID=159749 RepID=K0RF59_THAOC|nr:hypothetical protein THAOC_36238 [Thalassiosira oceanica]|eukprot:EJK45162.1 hypothetical protein THAOC_36238 [Thalassiosira oceanica]
MQTLNRSTTLAAPPSDDDVWHFCGTIDAAGCDNGLAMLPSEKNCNNGGDEPCSNAAAAATASSHRVRHCPDGDEGGPPCMARNVSVDGMPCRPCDPGSVENDDSDAGHAVHLDHDQQPPPLGGENDGPARGECHGEYGEEEDGDGFESDSEENDGRSESDEEESEAEESDAEDDEGDHQQAYPWGQEYETDEESSDDGVEAEDGWQLCGFLSSPGGRSYDSDSSSSYAGASCGKRRRSPGDHELFLPANLSPSVESLKYDSDDDDDESDDGGSNAYRFGRSGHGRRGGRAYMLGPPPRRPRLWDACPQITSVSSGSSSDSSGDESTTSSTAGKRRRDDPSRSEGGATRRKGVTFNPSVVVNPIFATEAYPPRCSRRCTRPATSCAGPRSGTRGSTSTTRRTGATPRRSGPWSGTRRPGSWSTLPTWTRPPRGGSTAGGSRVAVVRNAVRTRVVTYSSAGGYADETVTAEDDDEGAMFDEFDGGPDDDEEAAEAAVGAYYEEGDDEMRPEEDGGDGCSPDDPPSATTVVRTAKRMRMCWS